MIKDDAYFMDLALKEAKKAAALGEVPVGVIIVDNVTHKVVSKGYNLKERLIDVSAHAEIVAIRKLSKKIKTYKLSNYTMYVTLEPCSMCAGAIIQSNIGRLVFGAFEPEFGAFGSRFDITKTTNTNIVVEHSVKEIESKKLLREFFKERR